MLLFNATHLVTAWAPVVVMAHSIAPASKNCFEIFITLFPLYVHIDSCFGGQSPQNPKGRLFSAFLCGHYSGISGLVSTKTMPDLNVPLFSASFFCIFRQISAPQRAILLPLRNKVPLCGGVGEARGGHCGHCTPPPSCSARHPPPRTTHANYVCAGPGVAVGILLGYCSDMLSPVIPAQAGIGLWLLLVI